MTDANAAAGGFEWDPGCGYFYSLEADQCACPAPRVHSALLIHPLQSPRAADFFNHHAASNQLCAFPPSSRRFYDPASRLINSAGDPTVWAVPPAGNTLHTRSRTRTAARSPPHGTPHAPPPSTPRRLEGAGRSHACGHDPRVWGRGDTALG